MLQLVRGILVPVDVKFVYSTKLSVEIAVNTNDDHVSDFARTTTMSVEQIPLNGAIPTL